MRQAWLWMVLCFVGVAPVAGATAPRPKLAVMELRDESGTLRAKLRSSLTENLRRRLAALNRFDLIDRGRQAKALKRMAEEAKRESRKECYDERCQIPPGRALSADGIVRLSVGEIGGMCPVATERIDLAKEAVVGGAFAERASMPAKGREARVLGFDRALDLALVQIDAGYGLLARERSREAFEALGQTP